MKIEHTFSDSENERIERIQKKISEIENEYLEEFQKIESSAINQQMRYKALEKQYKQDAILNSLREELSNVYLYSVGMLVVKAENEEDLMKLSQIHGGSHDN